MHINIDYDKTFTSDPYVWTRILELLYDRCDNKLYCISQRTDTPENRFKLRFDLPHFVEVHCTNHNPKKEWAERRGINIDIWIEDNPLAIFKSDCPAKQVIDELENESNVKSTESIS